jgi:hypothetical protein
VNWTGKSSVGGDLQIMSFLNSISGFIIASHSRKIDGDLVEIGRNEKPARFSYSVEKDTLEAMTLVDGTQVWRNPRLDD